jgi:ABC-type sugar transport system ATPase subunit
MIYVTRDQTEAMTLGDLVAVRKLGAVPQMDTPGVLTSVPRISSSRDSSALA